VEPISIKDRINGLWPGIMNDPRSGKLNFKEKYRILLGKLLPWDIITGFLRSNPQLISGSTKEIDAEKLTEALKDWKFEIDGFVGYERSVVTAGGVSTEEITAKTLESKLKKGLFFCGEIIDTDSDTGGYNLQTAFSTGFLAGQSAAKQIISRLP